MKRIFAIFLAAMMLLCMVGCDQEQNQGNQGDQGNQGGIYNDDLGETVESTTEIPRFEIEQVVVLDNEYCTITINAIDPGNLWGYSLEAYMENKTKDQNLVFSVDSASINGVQTDPFFSTEIVAGKKSNELISFSGSALEKQNIGEYTDILLKFTVADADDWSAEAVAQTSVHVYPQGQDKAIRFERADQEGDKVLVDNEQLKVVAIGFELDEVWGYTMDLYLVNKTDKGIMFTIDDASINDYMADAFYAVSVDAGNCAFGSVSWSAFTLEKNKITQVDSVEFLLRAADDSDWMAADIFKQIITITH